MKDLKMAATEMEKEMPAAAPEQPKERYPYGCRITLTAAELDKLGLKGVPKVGSKFEIEALAVVESVHESVSKEGPEGGYRSVELQLTHMELDNDDGDGKDAGEKLYKDDEGGGSKE